jgi:nucleolar pre-ribosomal-associated protein 2
MEFCSLQLKGKMAQEHRNALNPGLYAVFDAMTADVQRAVNEALDPMQRAVYKGLYEDWKKFGRWEGN